MRQSRATRSARMLGMICLMALMLCSCIPQADAALVTERTLALDRMDRRPPSTIADVGDAIDFIPIQNLLFFTTTTNKLMLVDLASVNTELELVAQFDSPIQQTMALLSFVYLTVGDAPDNAVMWSANRNSARLFQNQPTELLTVFRDRLYYASLQNNGRRNVFAFSSQFVPSSNLGMQYDYQGYFSDALEDTLFMELLNVPSPELGPYYEVNSDGDLVIFQSPLGAAMPASPLLQIGSLGSFFFVTTNFENEALYQTDVTPMGTVEVKELNDLWQPDGDLIREPLALVLNNTLFCTAKDPEDATNTARLWKASSSVRNANLVDEGRPPNNLIDVRDPSSLVLFQEQVYYSGLVNNQDRELMVSDDDPLTTRIAVDLVPSGTGGSQPESMIVHDGKLFFWAKVNGTQDTPVYAIYCTDAVDTELIETFEAKGGPLFVYSDDLFVTGQLQSTEDVTLYRLVAYTESPTSMPTTPEPSSAPSSLPSAEPSMVPSMQPSSNPTSQPTPMESMAPSGKPSGSVAPTESAAPSQATASPSRASAAPTQMTEAPTQASAAPTQMTEVPTQASAAPTQMTEAPSEATAAPTSGVRSASFIGFSSWLCATIIVAVVGALV